MFTNTFSSTHCEVSASGNVLTAIAFLEGLAAEELAPAEFTVQDPSYEVVVFVRAVKDQAAA